MSSDPFYGDLRVVIEVSGGVAEENIDLAKGPVHTFIVDWDDITDEDTTPHQLKKMLANYPEDVQEYIKATLKPNDEEY